MKKPAGKKQVVLNGKLVEGKLLKIDTRFGCVMTKPSKRHCWYAPGTNPKSLKLIEEM